MEKQARIDRIKQVREQERNLAKEGLVDYAAKKQREAEEQAKLARYNDYIEKQRQIEHLKQLKA